MKTIRAKRPPDRADRIRRLWRSLWTGILLLTLGITLLCLGVGMLLVLPSAVDIENDPAMIWMGLGAFLVMPLGIGAILAAVTGFAFLRGFSLRALLIATACCGALIAANLRLEWSWSSDRMTFEKKSGELRFTVAQSAQSSNLTTGPIRWSSRCYVTSTFALAVDYLIFVCPPVATLPLILNWRVRTRISSLELRTSVTCADNFAPGTQEKAKPSTDVADGRR